MSRSCPQNAQCDGAEYWYGIARRIEQTTEGLLSINHGTLYPVLIKLEQEGAIRVRPEKLQRRNHSRQNTASECKSPPEAQLQ